MRNKIQKLEEKNALRSYGIVKDFLQSNPQFLYFEYSLLWISFHYLMNNNFLLNGKKKRMQVDIVHPVFLNNYYITFGKIPYGLIKKFDSINNLDIIINDKGLNLFTKHSLYFSPLYKKVKIGMHGVYDKKLDSLFYNFLSKQYSDIKRFEYYIIRIFSKKKPKFILLDEDRTKYKKVIIEIAKQFHIETFVIQHGIMPKNFNNNIPLSNFSFTPIIASYFFAWGNNSKKFLIDAGNNRNKIIVVGNPYIKKSNDKLTGDGVLIVDQQFDAQLWERNYAYSSLIKFLSKHKVKYSIYLRNQYNKRYFEKKFPNIKIIPWRKNGIIEEIRKHKTIIAFNSSAILESVYNERAVVVYDYFNRGDDMGFESSLIKIANNVDKILKLIEYFNSITINKQLIDETLKEHISYFGKEAVNNIYNEIVKRV